MRRAAICLAFGLFLTPGVLSAQQFQTPVRLFTGSNPSFVYVADLNSDGIPDIIFGDYLATPASVGTFLGQPGGGFVPGPTLQLPASVEADHCQIADVNSDGKPDLLCLNTIDVYLDVTVATFFGNGDGSFQAPSYSSGTVYGGSANLVPVLFTPADLNGDGHPDVLIHNVDIGFTDILLGDGAGNFANASTIVDGTSTWPYDYTVMDFNGDGKVDLARSIGPWVWNGSGNGNFTSGYINTNFLNCVYHDMDGDGRPDAVCGGFDDAIGSSELVILHGNADGSFSNTPIYLHTFGTTQETEGQFNGSLMVADLNGDGIPDILASSKDGFTVLLGQPGGLNFADPVHYAVGFLGLNGEYSSAFADMNGDGHLDVVAACPNGICISYGNADGTFQAPHSIKVTEEISRATVADFNGDGIPDIAATGDQDVEVSLGKGDGTFQPYISLDGGNASFVAETPGGAVLQPPIKHGDFRGNGKQDILAIGYTNTYDDNFYLFFGNGDGTFEPAQLVENVNLPFNGYWPFSVQDVNGDGRDDIVTVDASHIYVALSNGDGTFTTATTPMAAQFVGISPGPPVLADFSHDGKLDAVYASATNTMVLKGHGDGTFEATGLILPAPVIQGQNPGVVESIATGDFDGDGNLDIAELVEVNSNDIPSGYQPFELPSFGVAAVIYYGNGDGTFSAPVIAGTFKEPFFQIVAADVNNDGRDDLLLYSEEEIGGSAYVQGDGVALVLSEPGRLFAAEDDYFAGTPLNDLLVADLNRDGRLDLLGVNGSFFYFGYMGSDGNGVTPLLNLGNAAVSGLSTATTLSSSNSNPAAGSQVTLTATVSTSATGEPAPSGQIRFADQSGLSETATLAPVGATSAQATFTMTPSTGQDTVGASYSGDSIFAPSSALLTESVEGTPSVVTASVSPNPLVLGNAATLSGAVANGSGSSAPVPTGYVTILDNDRPYAGPLTLSNGTFSLDPSTFQSGLNNITVAYSGDSVHLSSSASLTLDVLVTPRVLLTFPAYTITTVQSAAATVTLSGESGSPAPTGTVMITGGGYTSPAAPVTNGSAAINIPAGALAIGSDLLTATYTPDAGSSTIYASGSGMTEMEVIPAPPGISLSGTSVTVTAGASSGNTSTITVTPVGGFTGSVKLNALTASAPAGPVSWPTLSFGNADTVTISGTNPVTAILTITTVAGTSGAAVDPFRRIPWAPIGGTAFAGLLVFLAPVRRHRQLRLLAFVIFLGALSAGVLACGGNGNAAPSGGGGSGSTGGGSGSTGNSQPTTLGTYTISIIGSSGAIASSTQISLTVK